MNISDESEYSSLFDKSEISSVTSTTATSSSKIISEDKGSVISDFQELISQENSLNFDKNAIFSKDDAKHSKGGQVMGKSSELESSNSDANRYVNSSSLKEFQFRIFEKVSLSIYILKKDVGMRL